MFANCLSCPLKEGGVRKGEGRGGGMHCLMHLLLGKTGVQ